MMHLSQHKITQLLKNNLQREEYFIHTTDDAGNNYYQ